MHFKLESLKYQDDAVQSVVKVFDGNETNTFDNASREGIRANLCTLSQNEIRENIQSVANDNGIPQNVLNLSDDPDLCIEMETGTGKTLVYVKTICELHKRYHFTKFIILVPSVAIRQGVLGTFKSFGAQLESIYGFKPNAFEYDSKKLSKVVNFIEDNHPQVMIMTLASFDSEGKILNQAQREDLFGNMRFIDAIGKTRPVILMDEPQEGMDTPNSIAQIANLAPICKIRYSATHKVVKNLLFRLTPYDSYKQNLVKKITVNTVLEKNDEATLKIELTEAENDKGAIKVKLKAWHQVNATQKFDFKQTGWLKKGDNLGEKTNNPSYLNYSIANIQKSLKSGKWTVTFSNGTEIYEKQVSGQIESVWATQIEYLIRSHFLKAEKLAPKGIKCLSLVFIDRVANYMGDKPIIKNLFVEKYKLVFAELNPGKTLSDDEIRQLQGYYFAQKASGEFADNEGGVKEQSKIYDLILKDKETLLSLDNPVQFIFSHSALGVGWDNPNVFNIATLKTAFSDTRKRQEIGRGLRICVDQNGQRVYDAPDVSDDDRINHLTVVPNESYETFVAQYQDEIKQIYGTTDAGAGMKHEHKGKDQNKVVITRNMDELIDAAFRRFWKAMAKKTDYTVAIDEAKVVREAIAQLNKIEISDFIIEVQSHTIDSISEDGATPTYHGSESYKQKAYFTQLDLIEELSENTGLSYPATLQIVKRLDNLGEFVKNPPRFIHEAAGVVRNIEREELVRAVAYHVTGEEFPFSFEEMLNMDSSRPHCPTPKRGVFDKMPWDSDVERDFMETADNNHDVVCFLKLPKSYIIPTPIGNYEPDFGLVMKRKKITGADGPEFYFVIETKGTNDLEDRKNLSQDERDKIKYAYKHFEAIGVDVEYIAPVKEFKTFETKAHIYIDKQPAKA